MRIWKRMMFILVLTFMTLGIMFVSVGYLNYRNALHDIDIKSKIEEIEKMEHYTAMKDIAPNLIKASIAIEDRRFYHHHGVEYRSMLRALITNIFAKGIVGGGSTITQQLSKNLYFDNQPSYLRKMSEIFMAYEIERHLSKEKILELYVNLINYGDNHIGIYKASMGYFNKLPKNLSLDEATLLAGLPQSPSNYQLSNHEQNARIRQRQVLEAMKREQMIDQKTFDKLVN